MRAVSELRTWESGAHVLDVGCGTGFTACCAALGGADSIYACDIQAAACDTTRRVHTFPQIEYLILSRHNTAL